MTKLVPKSPHYSHPPCPSHTNHSLLQLRDLLLDHLPIILQQAQRRPLDRSNLDHFGVPPYQVADPQIDSRHRVQGLFISFRFANLDGILVDFLVREGFRRGFARVDYRVGFGVDTGFCGAAAVVGCYRADLLAVSNGCQFGELIGRGLRDCEITSSVSIAREDRFRALRSGGRSGRRCSRARRW